MKFLRKRLFKRLPFVGRLADVAIVGASAMRLAQRRGLISESTASKFGAASSSGGSALSMGELAIAGGAALRLLRRKGSKKKLSKAEAKAIKKAAKR